MTIAESLTRFAAARHDGGATFPLSPSGDCDWETEMDAAEESLRHAKPTSVAEVNAVLIFVEREISQDPTCGAEMIAMMLANCREFLGRAG